jgi:DNA replication ATP-dependent helicase Dna2
MENGTEQSSGMPDLFESKTRHLSPSQIEYLKKWEALIELEKSDVHRFRTEMSTLSGPEREKLGRFAQQHNPLFFF